MVSSKRRQGKIADLFLPWESGQGNQKSIHAYHTREHDYQSSYMRFNSFLCFITFAVVPLRFSSSEVQKNAEKLPTPCNVDPVEYIRSHGYHAELHEVVTSDGYILAVHRVRSHNHLHKKKLQPLLLIHGMDVSSMGWLIASPHGGSIRIEEINYDTGETTVREEYTQNIGFALADRGYDVWLLNNRGNVYSTRHVTLNPFRGNSGHHFKSWGDFNCLPPLDGKFWDFDFADLALKDIPAAINYILNETKAGKLFLNLDLHTSYARAFR